MAAGLFRSRGYRVTRSRIRSALRSEDPISSVLHWPGGLTRRHMYSVAGPNSLWLIGIYRYDIISFKMIFSTSDSHHKLIRWRMAVHGGIDGYSRVIVYLKCSSNIRLTTIYEFFESSSSIPSSFKN